MQHDKYTPSLSAMDTVALASESTIALFCSPVRVRETVKLSIFSGVESSVMEIDTHDMLLVAVSVTLASKGVKSALPIRVYTIYVSIALKIYFEVTNQLTKRLTKIPINH